MDAADLDCVRRVYDVDYASARLPANLDARQREMESSVFAATLDGVRALDHVADVRHYYQTYVGRNYFHVEEQAAACVTASEYGRGCPASARGTLMQTLCNPGVPRGLC